MSSLKFRFSGLVAASSLVLGACATTASPPEAPVELANNDQRAAAERADPLTRARFWAGEYQKEPENIETAKYFASSLRAIESHDRVIQVVSDTLILYPSDYELLMLLGKSYLSLKKVDQASQAFGRAISVDNTRPDAFAALGLTYDRAGRHDFAQRAYKKALEIDPERTTTLTNYGLSLALTGNISGAEDMLRQAVARPDATTQVRQNLALVLGLQGKFGEMKTVDEAAPPAVMEQNAELLKQMIQQSPPVKTASLSPEFSQTTTATPPPVAIPDVKAEPAPVTEVASADLEELTVEVAKVSEPAPEPEIQPEPVKLAEAIVPSEPEKLAPSPEKGVETILASAPKAEKKPEAQTQTARLPGGLRGSLQD